MMQGEERTQKTESKSSFCTNCGQMISEEQSFCKSCGYKVLTKAKFRIPSSFVAYCILFFVISVLVLWIWLGPKSPTASPSLPVSTPSSPVSTPIIIEAPISTSSEPSVSVSKTPAPTENPFANYIALAQSTSHQILVSLEEIGKTVAQYPNIDYFSNSVWNCVQVVKNCTANMVGAAIPIGLEQVHSSIVAGCERYSWAMDLLKEAVQGATLDYSKVEEAISLMDSGKDYFVIANSIPNELGQSLSLELLPMADYVDSQKPVVSSTPKSMPTQAPLPAQQPSDASTSSAEFQSVLSQLQIKFPGRTRTEISNIIVAAKNRIDTTTTAHKTLLQIAQGISSSVPTEAIGLVSLEEIAAAYVSILRQFGE